MRLKVRVRHGVSEIISIALLVLMAVALGTTLYLIAASNIGNLYWRLKVQSDLAMARLAYIPVLDAFYDNGLITIVIYVPDDLDFNPYFKTAYVDGVKVPSNNLVEGFNEVVPLDSVHKLVIEYSLSSGTHLVKVIDSHGAEVEVVISIG